MSTASAAVAETPPPRPLHRHTPLVHSAPLSRLAGRPVYCKLDALQASGSFKDRGMAHLCQTLRQRQPPGPATRLVSSSGGNAGLAVATMARRLGMPVRVVVPETTKPVVLQKLRDLGAEVTVHGANWNAADRLAREIVDELNAVTAPTGDGSAGSSVAAVYVSPYDHPLLWTGHSTVVDEIVEDLPQAQDGDGDLVSGAPGAAQPLQIAALLLSVGGGGLLCGALEGLRRHGLAPAVLACETEGAASFSAALREGRLVRLPAIASVATSLGALEVAPEALARAVAYNADADASNGARGRLLSAVCTDAEAVEACLRFAQDHRMLVEPACGAALAPLYSERLRRQLLPGLPPDGCLVVEVCGGSGVTLELLDQWKRDVVEYADDGKPRG